MPRYIDADALKKLLQNLAHDDWNQITCTTWAEAFEEVADMIDGTPTADVVERKIGKWIWMGEQGDSRFMCSVCKSKENVPTIMGKPTVWEYCPNCGAEMDQ